MLGNILMAGFLFSLNMIFLIVAAALRLLPSLLNVARRAIRIFMVLSFRLYSLILTNLAPLIGSYFGVNILTGYLRILSTIILSLTLGLLLSVLIGLPISGWSIGILATHGLFVGLAWDEVTKSEGFQLGVHIE